MAPTLFNACMDWMLGQIVARSSHGILIDETRIMDLDFVDDAVILEESLNIFKSTHFSLNEESEQNHLALEYLGSKQRSSPVLAS